MKNMSRWIFSALLIFSFCAQGKEDSASLIKKLESLDSSANLLMAAADERIPAEQVCKINSEKAFSLMNPLQAKVDEAKEKYIKSRKLQKKRYSEDSWVKTCETSCHCGLYSAVLEQVGFEQLQKPDQQAFRKLSSLAMNQPKEALTACAKKETSFCSSPLLKELEKEASNSK